MRNRNASWFAALVAALIPVALIAGTALARAAVELDEAEIFIEINDTDGDAGIQVFLDGEDWNQIKIFDPDGKKILDIGLGGSVGMQGGTELALESAEPSFDEQPLAEFLALFPEGTYRFVGKTTDNEALEGEAELTHILPDAPNLVSPADGDDAVDPDDTAVVWNPVSDPPGSSIVVYQVIVEREEPSLLVFRADIVPSSCDGTCSVTVPSEFMMAETEYKYEVLAIEESGNRTISEAEFETE